MSNKDVSTPPLEVTPSLLRRTAQSVAADGMAVLALGLLYFVMLVWGP